MALSAEEASRWMHRGIDLLNIDSPASLEKAVGCFDLAIALRRTLPVAENSRHGYGLAAGWINRGDALARLGRPEAISSYDEAITLLESLPLGEDPLYPRRLVIAWINRGLVGQQRDSPINAPDAIRCFREAIRVLEEAASAAIADRALLHAGALLNLAGALLDSRDSDFAEAGRAAQQARALVKETECHEMIAAEIGWKARHLFCRAMAAEVHEGKLLPFERVAEAAEAIHEALTLIQHWQGRGEDPFTTVGEDLFHFGCRIYQLGQPHLLLEFILKTFDPEKADIVLPLNAALHEIADAALWNALGEIQRAAFPSSGPQLEAVLEKVGELRETEARLNSLRQSQLGLNLVPCGFK